MCVVEAARFSFGTGGRGMLVVETIGRIRREFFVKGKTIKEIVRDVKVSRNTVRKVLRSGATSFEYEREVQPLPKLGAWRPALDPGERPYSWRLCSPKASPTCRRSTASSICNRLGPTLPVRRARGVVLV